MKQKLLNTFVGNISLWLRDKYILLKAAFDDLESIGIIANDQLATLLITRICQSNKVFVDVGAHIGSVVSEVMRSDSSIEIIAIEAIPEKVKNLKTKFPKVKTIECAVGTEKCETSFYVDVERSGYSSLDRSSQGGSATKEIKVTMEKLDDIVPLAGVDAIKIDVEGAELGVIQGGKEFFSKCRPTVMFESAFDPDETKKIKIWELFTEMGYVILVPNRLAHNDNGLSVDGFLESHTYPRRTTNYFAVPSERRNEIRDRARQIIGVKVP